MQLRPGSGAHTHYLTEVNKIVRAANASFVTDEETEVWTGEMIAQDHLTNRE